jgi:hypothetical protein
VEREALCMQAMWQILFGTIIFEDMSEYTLLRKYKCKQYEK